MGIEVLSVPATVRLGVLLMKTVTVPTQLAAPTDLDMHRCESVAAAINPLVADAFALYLKTKNFHWHMSGAHFRDYHLLLDDHGEDLMGMTDVLAERSRKVGQMTIHSIGEVSRLQRVRDDDRSFVEPIEMLRILMADNRDLTERMRTAHRICEEAGDVATTSLLENFIDQSERRTWFLYEATLG
jgi:starvation-inducible DNA-binding protein